MIKKPSPREYHRDQNFLILQTFIDLGPSYDDSSLEPPLTSNSTVTFCRQGVPICAEGPFPLRSATKFGQHDTSGIDFA